MIAEQTCRVLFKRDGKADGFAGSADRCFAVHAVQRCQRPNMDDVAEVEEPLSLSLIEPVTRFTGQRVCLDADGIRRKPDQFDNAAIGRTVGICEASPGQKGINGDLGTKRPGAGPWVRAAMGEAMGGVVARDFLAAVRGVPKCLDGKCARRARHQLDGGTDCGDRQRGARRDDDARRSRMRPEQFNQPVGRISEGTLFVSLCNLHLGLGVCRLGLSGFRAKGFHMRHVSK